MLDVGRLLPRTNFRLCSEATCMTFAFGLLQPRRILTEWPPPQTDAALSEQGATLERML